MRNILNLAGVAAIALALAACGGHDKGAGGLSADEERELDNAAAMLDSNNLVVADDSMGANEAEVVAGEDGSPEAAVNAANTQ
jgi:hypothetical protein